MPRAIKKIKCFWIKRYSKVSLACDSPRSSPPLEFLSEPREAPDLSPSIAKSHQGPSAGRRVAVTIDEGGGPKKSKEAKDDTASAEEKKEGLEVWAVM